ncbi:MAG TPA: hypothetical protein PKL92_09655 [Aquaticitalea sp.]|nr:hypothetical protein [Aquaticitalea sp.]
MKYCIFLWAALFLSCSNESSVQLPQIVHSGNSIEKNDSKAFMKYDKNASEPLHFRGSDLPSVFYIDSRISLKLLLPETIKLMDKKRSTTDGKNSEKSYFAFKTNKNDDVRLWDSSEIEYHQVANESAAEIALLQQLSRLQQKSHITEIVFKGQDAISINSVSVSKTDFVNRLRYMDSVQSKMQGLIFMKFDGKLTFQEYLTYKSMVENAGLKHATVSKNEFVFN